MKCDFCKYAPSPGQEGDCDECPFWDKYGTVWKDGRDGCTVHPATIKKLDRMRDQDFADMGLDMGIEYDFEHRGISMDETVENAKHTVGMDQKRHKPYHRHGKLFYTPWRNWWTGRNEAFEYFCEPVIGLMKKTESDYLIGGVGYHFTRSGLDWLGRQIGVKINDLRKGG